MTTEHQKARLWREAHNLSLKDLAPLIGYSTASIYWFEAGQTPPRTYKGKRSPERKGRAIAPEVWLRYKAACAGIDAWLKDKRRFDW
jgi:predicted transcriptional regulator